MTTHRLLCVLLLVLAGCTARNAEFLGAREWKGCYWIEGGVSANAPAVHITGQATGIIVTGGATPEECQTLRTLVPVLRDP